MRRLSARHLVKPSSAPLRGFAVAGTGDVEMLFRTRLTAVSFLLSAPVIWFVPGFGYQHPAGDPRGQKLIGHCQNLCPTDGSRVGEIASSSIAPLTGGYTTLDFGLVMFARALKLSLEAPIAIFAPGRTVGSPTLLSITRMIRSLGHEPDTSAQRTHGRGLG